jgi:hypothetical protein
MLHLHNVYILHLNKYYGTYQYFQTNFDISYYRRLQQQAAEVTNGPVAA